MIKTKYITTEFKDLDFLINKFTVENDITKDKLIDIKFNSTEEKVDVLIIYDDLLIAKSEMEKIKFPDKTLSVYKAFSVLEKNGKKNIVLRDLANVMNITPNTVRKKIKEQGGFEIINQGLGNPSIVKRIK